MTKAEFKQLQVGDYIEAGHKFGWIVQLWDDQSGQRLAYCPPHWAGRLVPSGDCPILTPKSLGVTVIRDRQAALQRIHAIAVKDADARGRIAQFAQEQYSTALAEELRARKELEAEPAPADATA